MSHRILGIAVLGIVLSLTTRGMAQLDANQQRVLNEAKSQLTQLQTNLRLATESAGPAGSTPTAARGRLALTRLDSTAQAVANIDARLKLLPAEDEAVKAFVKEYDTAKQSITDLRTRLTSPSTPAAPTTPTTPTTPAPSAPTTPAPSGAPAVRLDYRQEQNLKDAQFTIREVQGRADALAEVVGKVKPIADPNTIDHRLMVTAMNRITDARRRAGQAAERFTTLPPEGPGVAEAKQQLAGAVASVDASEVVIKPIHERLMKLIDPASHPNLAADTTRLRELAQQYGSLDLFQTNRTRVAMLVKEEPAAKQELARILQLYSAFIGQQTEQSRQIEGSAKYLAEKLQAFDAASASAKQSLPGEIDSELARVNQMADEAVSQQKPAFFGGGIPQQMSFAEEKVILYESLDPTGASAFRAKLTSAQQGMKQREASLKDAIIAANVLPPDRYSGADKEAMKALAIETWKQSEPAAQVLAVRFPSQSWDRETMWRLQNTTWYKIDRSKLQAQLIVKVDDKVAAIRPINLWRDHLKSDQISANPLFGKDEVLSPASYMLVEKVR